MKHIVLCLLAFAAPAMAYNSSVCTVESFYDSYCVVGASEASSPLVAEECLHHNSHSMGFNLMRDGQKVKWYGTQRAAFAAAAELQRQGICVYTAH